MLGFDSATQVQTGRKQRAERSRSEMQVKIWKVECIRHPLRRLALSPPHLRLHPGLQQTGTLEPQPLHSAPSCSLLFPACARAPQENWKPLQLSPAPVLGNRKGGVDGECNKPAFRALGSTTPTLTLEEHGPGNPGTGCARGSGDLS